MVMGILLLITVLAGPISAAESSATPRVLLVGVDGATWKVIGPLIDTDQLPNFRHLVQSGAYMRQFETLRMKPRSQEGAPSPAIWTTIATGRSMEDHGIGDYITTLPNGKRIPITSNTRKVPALWEIVTRARKSAGVVNWWASWPAEQINGYVITDHANPAFSEALFDEAMRNPSRALGYWTADREVLKQMKRDFHPLELAPTLAKYWLTKDAFPYEDLQERGGFSPAQMAVMRQEPWNRRTYYSLLKTYYRVDYPLFLASKELIETSPADLVMLYFRGPDPIQHYAWDLVEPERYAVPPQHLERDRGLVKSIYRYIDTFLGELLSLATPETWVFVVSDHGAEPEPAATGNPRRARPGAHSFNAKGVLFIRGPHVKPGHQIVNADPYDLAPTILWLLDIPISEELEGKVIAEAFEDEFTQRNTVPRVASYGQRKLGTDEASPADEAMLKNLKALGYIE